MSFAELGLTPELLRAVADQGYTEPTPVQREAIPIVLAGRDLLAGAQTGTGKTAAFVLPILQRLNATRTPGWQSAPPAPGNGSRKGRDASREPIRTLVLTPTRELALQVEESVRTYGAHRRIRSVAIYGGVGSSRRRRRWRPSGSGGGRRSPDVLDLGRELAGRGQDEGPDRRTGGVATFPRAVGRSRRRGLPAGRSGAVEQLEDRQDEGGGLAGAGLGSGEQVAAGEDDRDRLALDRGGLGVALVGAARAARASARVQRRTWETES